MSQARLFKRTIASFNTPPSVVAGVGYGNLKDGIREAIEHNGLLCRISRTSASLRAFSLNALQHQMTSSLEGCATTQRRGCDASRLFQKEG